MLTGEFGQLAKGNPVAIRINDSIFLHGGNQRLFWLPHGYPGINR